MPFVLLPARTEFLYLCPDGELHQAKAWIWGFWAFGKRDRVMVSKEGLQKIAVALGEKKD